jgi:hypothetical protein
MSDLMGLQFSGTVKIRSFDTFELSKSRGGEYRVSYGETLKLSSRRRLQGSDIFYV